MTQFPKAAIVILNWNGKNFLKQFLPALQQTDYPNFEIIVADNGSTDDSVEFLEKEYPDIKIIRFPKNLGFAKGYNEALKRTVADYYVLLNSDVEVTSGWLLPMIGLLEKDKSVAACQPKLLNWKNKNLFEYAGGAGGWIDMLGYPFAKGRIFDSFEEDYGQYDTPEPVFWASGAAMCIRSNIFHQLGGFDEFFFAHQEEIDLCWRIQLAGYKIYSCPDSVVYHVGGGTLPKENSLKTYLNFRNNRIMLSKNLPWNQKLWIIPFRFLLDMSSAFKGLITGKVGFFRAILRAHIDFLKWFIFYRHKSVFPKKRNSLLYGRLKKMVVWEYFIKGKKTFQEIVKKNEKF